MDIRHDRAEPLVHFLCRPFESHRVLGHLESGSSHTSGIGCLTRRIENLSTLEDSNSFRCRRHVSSFGNTETTVVDQVLGICFLYLVLRSTGHRDIACYLPRPFACKILCLRIFGYILLDTSAAYILQLEHKRHLLFIQPFRIIDKAVGIGECQHFGAESHSFLRRKLRHITGTGDAHFLSLKIQSAGSQHRFCEIASAVSRGLRTHEASAPGLSLTGKRACKLITQTLILAEHISYLSSSYTDISSRHIRVCAYMTLQLRHKRLAEPHHFRIRFTSRREI